MSQSGNTTRLTSSHSPSLRGTIEVPGDKSISHRALILGGMAAGTTAIRGLLESHDVIHTAHAIELLGATVERIGRSEWGVTGAEWQSPPHTLDCGNSGTGVRLLMGACAGFPIDVTLTGDESLRMRPMNRVLDPLRRMGAIASSSASGLLPVTFRGGNLRGISFRNPTASAQVKSAVLLAGLRAAGNVEVFEDSPSRDHTENMLRAFGCDVATGNTADRYFARLGMQRNLQATTIDVPGDPSSAAFPIVAALITPGSEITIANVMMNPLRIGLFTTLLEMGADLTFTKQRTLSGEPVANVTARASLLHGVTVPAERAPSMIDEYPVLAIAAACATGETRAEGLAELRVKESDRLGAIVAGLIACGSDARADGDALVIGGNGAPPFGAAAVETRGDHRIAMSFLVFGLAARESVSVDDAHMIATSFPGFAELMQSLGARIERMHD